MSAGNRQPHIGFAISDTRHGAWAFMEQGAVEQAQQLGVRLTVLSATSRAEQSNVIREFIGQRVDGLIIASLGNVEAGCFEKTGIDEATQRPGVQPPRARCTRHL